MTSPSRVSVATLLLLGVTTGLMGLLPTYTTAGIASPIMLVVLRFIQGAALGGGAHAERLERPGYTDRA